MTVLQVAVLLFALGVAAVDAGDTNALPTTITFAGETYEDVTWGTVSSSSVTIKHKSGIARIPLAKLPAELQKRLGYDPEVERVRIEKLRAEQSALLELKRKQEEQAKQPLTGNDLVAWKLARQYLSEKDGKYHDYSECVPEVGFMKKTPAGDYVFTFFGRGRKVSFYDEHATTYNVEGRAEYQPGYVQIQQPDHTAKVTVTTIGGQMRVDPNVD